MDTKRKVTAQGVMFNNRLYRSDALKALVGQYVKLKFDGPAGDPAVVIWEDSVIDVRLWKRGNPPNDVSLPAAAGDSLPDWTLKPRISD
ncbi:Mu transposase C-terminal domain-containing protein [Pseudomonas alliivorans]|nr:Mu transposase C-terminal domain-containing protein [Pseudomonas alliivorans]MEE4701289.1 Mu transposase C-terminal domain-containing protein [Pseudomonas alliivorans]MEE4737177.1 Mu transposase C-terminal domain-containing protein [Pseudomonas alliivorans]